MNHKYKIIALYGESGAGKDTILSYLYLQFSHVLHLIVQDTTRPKRENEKDGVEYHFLSEEEYNKATYTLCASKFRDWYYRVPLEALSIDLINIGIFSIDQINQLKDNSILEVYPIYINTNPKERLLRVLNRESNPDVFEACRRFMADERDFSNIPFDNYTVINNNENIDLIKMYFRFAKLLAKINQLN